MKTILAIDQGTSSSRAFIFDENMQVLGVGQREFPQYYPKPGWVEHAPEEIWQSVLDAIAKAMAQAKITPQDIVAIGIANQRETSLIWDRETGVPLHRAIVWQDRRTASECQKWRAAGYENLITKKTGLLLDPYFSASKLAWFLEHIPGARDKARAGKLAFGTVDTFLMSKFTGAKVHKTDATNAARTMLYDIHKGAWCQEILDLFDIPSQILPTVHDCAHEFGVADPAILGAKIPILGVAGDQQAATIGQAAFEKGMVKATYGTGCFALLNTGTRPVESKNRLLTTIAYQLDGAVTYALEGSIFIAGAAVQWLRDGLGILENASQSEALAQKANPDEAVVLVPAFAGLGAPYWDAQSRGAIFGLSRATGPAELARATLQSVIFQTRDLIAAMQQDGAIDGDLPLRVDGGFCANNYAMEFLADILDRRIERPKITETTVLGVAWLAGMRAGIYPDAKRFAKFWEIERVFTPNLDAKTREMLYARWKAAVQSTIHYTSETAT